MPSYEIDSLASKTAQIYNENKREIEKHIGFVAIDPVSERFCIDDTLEKVRQKVRKINMQGLIVGYEIGKLKDIIFL